MKRSKFMIIILILSLLITSICPIFASSNNEKTIYIKTAKELYQLAKDCAYDKYSKDLKVVLENDIDLKEEEFIPIPIFGGIFEGNNYSIKGLYIGVEGSNEGFIRYLSEGAIIRNLNFEGKVIPTGDKVNIGGVVGYNYGTIENVKFSGFVKGKEVVGGIVGWNSTKGKILNSIFSGVIYGENKVGGISGYNAGTIYMSKNFSNVNTTVEEHKIDFTEITLENINPTKLLQDATDIGGIAGVNTGVIQSSENYGVVGYPHVGYNVGGIAGRQSGYINKAINHGNIKGRKEVAGITGQMEPHITSIMEPSKLKELKRELNKLQISINRILDDGRGISDVMGQNILYIQDNISMSKIHTEALINQTEVMLNKDIEEINKISVVALEAIDKLLPITESLESLIKTMDKAIKPMKKSMEYMLDAMRELPKFKSNFEKIIRIMESSLKTLENIETKLNNALADIKRAVELLKEFKIDEALQLLKSSWNSIESIFRDLEKTIDALKPLEGIILNMISSMDNMVSNMINGLDYMIDALDIMENAIDDIESIIEDTNILLKYLSRQDSIKFQTTDDLYQRTKENLFDSIDDVSMSLSQLIKNVKTQSHMIMNDMEGINNQLFKVLNLMINLIDKVGDGELDIEDIVKDVSRKDIENKIEGKVSDSRNLGKIEGDINVGGIAGAMSIEFKFDPEEDLELGKKLSMNKAYESRAIIYNCENSGEIIGKKNNIGGIVGNMDLGYIKNTISSNSVESTDGNYVGGIAGRSQSAIESSYAKGTLFGGNYIGGIAGLGKEILNSCTMVNIGRSKAYIGSIAGNVEQNSIIKNNYFVSDKLHGIDGISYMNKAEPISYEDLINKENTPLIFKEFKLIFLADGKIVDRLHFVYGSSFDNKKLPNIPIKDGYYARWEDIDLSNLKFDATINAEYIPYLRILESKELRENTLPIVLVEGKFVEGDTINLQYKDSNNSPYNNELVIIDGWKLTIPDDGNKIHTIRYLPPSNGKNIKVHALKNNKWEAIENTWDGKYIIFSVDENEIDFNIVKKNISYGKYIIIGISFILLIAIFLRIILRKRRLKTNE